MGIGNGRVFFIADNTDDLSLPLMGIGNRQLGLDPRPGPGPHYPSWGSETRSLRPRLAPAHCRSLPLMGIGNPYLQKPTRVLCGLHMPKRPCHLGPMPSHEYDSCAWNPDQTGFSAQAQAVRLTAMTSPSHANRPLADTSDLRAAPCSVW